jgi:hypothetical protein
VRRGAVVMLSFTLAGLVMAGPAQAANPPTPGGCKAFGRHVSGLARNPAIDFGTAASGAATAYRGPSFPELVVRPEQDKFCP